MNIHMLFPMAFLLCLASCGETAAVRNDAAETPSITKATDTDLSDAEAFARNIAAELNRNNAAVSSQTFPSDDGRLYREELVRTISHSDRIVISEHSTGVDFYNPNKPGLGMSDVPLYVYGESELSQEARSKFLEVVQALDPTTQDAFPACIFQDHHTIRFYAGSKLKSTMRICFHCGQIEWDGSDRDPPWSLAPGLKLVVESVGFKAEQDWPAKAGKHADATAFP